jgi:hypothetical protein
MVARSDSATGRPMPRLANHAYPPPSAIGARTAVYASSSGNWSARVMIWPSCEPRPCSRTTSGAVSSEPPRVATTGVGKVMRSMLHH